MQTDSAQTGNVTNSFNVASHALPARMPAQQSGGPIKAPVAV
ncbi:MAG: hypothetical protein JWQ76_4741 [Ramlibacter sp.]|nr:hypothetical protein [Ramlibacter sp.]